MERDVVLSGIRATGKMHLGNYFGAIKKFVVFDADKTKQCFFFIANLHTLTTWTPPDELRKHLAGIVLDFLACGIDPTRSVLYAQSSVPEISELNWLLACLTSVNELEGMVHYKDKREKMEKSGQIVSAGLFTYPVLMTADILGPRATIVPVGEDQKPHVELARDIAKRFNRLYGDFFPLPDAIVGTGAWVPGLGASGKMGKSEDQSGVLNLSDSTEEIKRKFAIAMTDPARRRRTDPGDPEKCNIYTFHHLLSTVDEIDWACKGCKSAGIGCMECKMVVANHVNEVLAPIQAKRRELDARGLDFVLDVLSDGGKRARARFAETVESVKEKMGVPAY